MGLRFRHAHFTLGAARRPRIATTCTHVTVARARCTHAVATRVCPARAVVACRSDVCTSHGLTGACVWAASAQAQGQRGYAFTKTPLDGIGTEWEIDVEFRIHGGGMTYYGDGFAMWYTPTKYEEGHCTSRSLSPNNPPTTSPLAHAT